MGGRPRKQLDRSIKPRTQTSRGRLRATEPQGKIAHLLTKKWSALSLDLRHPNYKPDVYDVEEACLEHCYICAEAAYHLFGKQAGFVPYVHSHGHGTHWWLYNEDSGELLDPSLPQHRGRRYAYEKGHRGNFLTDKPSRRARELMRRMRSQGKLY